MSKFGEPSDPRVQHHIKLAATYLELHLYKEAEAIADRVLHLVPHAFAALFTRSLARENLRNLDGAYADMVLVADSGYFSPAVIDPHVYRILEACNKRGEDMVKGGIVKHHMPKLPPTLPPLVPSLRSVHPLSPLSERKVTTPSPGTTTDEFYHLGGGGDLSPGGWYNDVEQTRRIREHVLGPSQNSTVAEAIRVAQEAAASLQKRQVLTKAAKGKNRNRKANKKKRNNGPKKTLRSISAGRMMGLDSEWLDEDEYSCGGFTESATFELVCQGVHPWDEDS
ncbi:hypothetical protein VNI00_013295 [Paramarasmius palmivorus]|uniref:Uncharacterized protein n=1 Tax=Paramarasmius palmivorus TaxID=297713 RepID=A0AAW0C1A4_9AGAR